MGCPYVSCVPDKLSLVVVQIQREPFSPGGRSRTANPSGKGDGTNIDVEHVQSISGDARLDVPTHNEFILKGSH